MKRWMMIALAGVSLGASAEPLVVVNALATRPLFTVEASGVVQTRTVAPGQRAVLEPGLFSGLGIKKVPLVGGSVYYLAWLGSLPSLYRLTAEQTLVLNQAGQPVNFAFVDTQVTGVLATGTLALGSSTPTAPLKARWSDAQGRVQTATLEAGRVYRLVLDSPEGLGTTVSLKLWD